MPINEPEVIIDERVKAIRKARNELIYNDNENYILQEVNRIIEEKDGKNEEFQTYKQWLTFNLQLSMTHVGANQNKNEKVDFIYEQSKRLFLTFPDDYFIEETFTTISEQRVNYYRIRDVDIGVQEAKNINKKMHEINRQLVDSMKK